MAYFTFSGCECVVESEFVLERVPLSRTLGLTVEHGGNSFDSCTLPIWFGTVDVLWKEGNRSPEFIARIDEFVPLRPVTPVDL